MVTDADDPMTDLCAMALACRDFARRNPHLYDLMFGLSIHGRYTPSRTAASSEPRERSAAFTASYSLLLAECARLVETDCVRKIDPDLIAAQLWSALHGFIMLELGGFRGTRRSGRRSPRADVRQPDRRAGCRSQERRIVRRRGHNRLGAVVERATRCTTRPQRRISPAQTLKTSGAARGLPSEDRWVECANHGVGTRRGPIWLRWLPKRCRNSFMPTACSVAGRCRWNAQSGGCSDQALAVDSL